MILNKIMDQLIVDRNSSKNYSMLMKMENTKFNIQKSLTIEKSRHVC